MDKSIALSDIKQLDSEIASKTTLLYALANIMEGYTLDIKSAMLSRDILTQSSTKKKIYSFDVKKTVDAIYKNTVDFRNNLNKHFKDNETFKLEFGNSTDLLEDTIKEVIKEKVGFGK